MDVGGPTASDAEDEDVEEEDPREDMAKAPMDEGDMGSTMIL